MGFPGWGHGSRQSIDFGHGSGPGNRLRPPDHSARKLRRMAIERENTFTVLPPPQQAWDVLWRLAGGPS
jgi:hypothetical protein